MVILEATKDGKINIIFDHRDYIKTYLALMSDEEVKEVFKFTENLYKRKRGKKDEK